MWQEIQAERLNGARGFTGLLASNGPLRDDLHMGTAGDIVWILIDASLYHRLVIGRGRPKARFQYWLAEALTAQLLNPPPRARPRARG